MHFRNISLAEPSENYYPKLRSVAVVAAAVGRRHLGKPASPAKKFFPQVFIIAMLNSMQNCWNFARFLVPSLSELGYCRLSILRPSNLGNFRFLLSSRRSVLFFHNMENRLIK